MHPKTAVLSLVMEGTSRFVNDFPTYVHEVYRQGEPTTLLHLKIWLSRDVRKRAGTPMSLKLDWSKTVLMPAQHIYRSWTLGTSAQWRT